PSPTPGGTRPARGRHWFRLQGRANGRERMTRRRTPDVKGHGRCGTGRPRPLFRGRPLVAQFAALLAAGFAALGAAPLRAPAGPGPFPGPPSLLPGGKRGAGRGDSHSPIGIAVSQAAAVLVTDFHTARVQRFSPAGKHLASFAVLPNPGGIALDAAG